MFQVLTPSVLRRGNTENLRKRREAVIKAMEQYGYRQQEIASHLSLHYSSVSRVVKGESKM